MDYLKSKQSYLSLKRTLESTKYKLKHPKAQEKTLQANANFTPTSFRPTRKPSEVTTKVLNPSNYSNEKSTVFHGDTYELSNSFDTCLCSFSKIKNNEKSTQTSDSSSPVDCPQEVNDGEIQILRCEVLNLRRALKDIRNLLGVEEGWGRDKGVGDERDDEDRRGSAGYKKFQEKIDIMKKLYE